MVTITVTVFREDQIPLALQKVGELVAQGYTSGQEPSWDISGEDEPDDEDDR